MKKLFKMDASISIIDFSSVQISGPYALQKLSPDSAVVETNNYTVEVGGEDLLVEVLSEEVALFTFSLLTRVVVSKDGKSGVSDVS